MKLELNAVAIGESSKGVGIRISPFKAGIDKKTSNEDSQKITVYIK